MAREEGGDANCRLRLSSVVRVFDLPARLQLLKVQAAIGNVAMEQWVSPLRKCLEIGDCPRVS
jgi:hypothetical protein